jgi:Response regulator containing CheY-like receiver, AAA-type ATPase, and DNA-binding domains
MAAAKILLVDDEGLMLALYKGYLERAGYQLLTAKSGEEAIEIAARERPDLIVMDVIMQGMSGLAALRALKTNDTTDRIPVMIVTAAVDKQRAAARRESMLGGAVRFLTKPITPTQLLAEIQYALSTPQGEISDGK